MNYGKLNKTDIANGSGVRVSLYVSGCRNRCKGCFNPETWNFKHGEEFTEATVREIYDALAPDHIAGLTVLGGDPLESENIGVVNALLYSVKQWFTNKTTWLYTGYRYEDFKDAEIMEYIDILVDGPFIEELKDISLNYRGSSNQRIIDVQASRRAGEVVEVEL